MGKEAFYFIVCIILLLQLEQIESPVMESLELIVCSVLILTLGISHGGIDNILHDAKTNNKKQTFIAVYLAAALVNVVLWFIIPNFSFIVFILISSYHFGQSQFIDYKFKDNFISKCIYFSWGALVITSLVFFNKPDILTSYWYNSLSLPALELLIEFSFEISLVLSIMIAGFVALKYTRNEITLHQILIEIYQLFLIFIAFKLFSLILGFTLYFIILHSLRVLNHEYKFLKQRVVIQSPVKFVKLLLPFTVISIFGMGVILFVIVFFNINISLPLLALILTSSVTLPHSYVMDVFYNSKFNINTSIRG